MKVFGIKLQVPDDALVFCQKCQNPLQQGVRVLTYDQKDNDYSEKGLFHLQCLEEPLYLLRQADFDYLFIPAVYMQYGVSD